MPKTSPCCRVRFFDKKKLLGCSVWSNKECCTMFRCKIREQPEIILCDVTSSGTCESPLLSLGFRH